MYIVSDRTLRWPFQTVRSLQDQWLIPKTFIHSPYTPQLSEAIDALGKLPVDIISESTDGYAEKSHDEVEDHERVYETKTEISYLKTEGIKLLGLVLNWSI